MTDPWTDPDGLALAIKKRKTVLCEQKIVLPASIIVLDRMLDFESVLNYSERNF